jgi:DNA invertase Pin-like site-specific DNA recombinase
MENQVVGYTRVSAEDQELKNQRYEILNYADKSDLAVSRLVEIKVSSRKSTKARLMDTLFEQMSGCETLIVANYQDSKEVPVKYP